MKRLMGKLASLVGAFLLAGAAWAETWTDENDHTWTFTVGATSATVTGVDPLRGVIAIPATLGDKPVTAFGTIFKGQADVTRVTIPAGVTAIPDQAFLNCKNLKGVTINGETLKSIGYQAFKDCYNMTSFVIPNSVKTLGQGVFSGCSALEEVTIGDGITTLTGVPYVDGNGRYYDYENSTNLNDSYGNGLFYNCTSLKTINWGKNVKTIGNIAFLGCSALEKVEIPDTVTSIGNHAFYWCGNLGEVKIGAKVATVGRMAFRADKNLTKVTFGNSVTEIQQQAFQDCVNLQNFTLPTSLQYLRYRCFAGCSKALTEVTIPTNRDELETELSQGVFSGCSKLGTVTIGDTVKTLTGVPYVDGNGRYYDYENSTNLNDSYGNGLFYNCTSLKTINWGKNVKTIGNIAFLGCSALEKVEIPDTVTSIGNHAFYWCENLGEVKIGAKVATVGRMAFRADGNLTKVVFGKSVTEIQQQAFQDCVNLQNFTLPTSLQYLRYRCFAGCSKSLTEVTIPTNRDELETELSQGVFSGCSKLATVTIGDTVKTLTGVPYVDGNGRYYDYENSTNLNDSYGNGLFYNCTSLKTINWGKGVKTIGNVAFLNCTALEKVSLPANVSEIGCHAFYGCSSLKWADMAGAITSFGRRAFANCPKLEFVNFRGASMAFDAGTEIFAFDNANIIAYAAVGSTGWTGVADVGGLPTSGTWRGAKIMYGAGKIDEDPVPTVYTVTFDTNGGTCATATKDVEDGAAVGELPVATREGYAFLGWFTAAGGQVDATTKVTANLPLVAQWKKDEDPQPPTPPAKTVVKIAKPTAATGLVYCGDGLSGALGRDVKLVFEGDLVATNAGTYAVAFALPADTETETFMWADGSVEDVAIEWTIDPLDVEDESVNFGEIPAQVATGAEIKPVVTMAFGETTCEFGTDYTVAYSDNVVAGTGHAMVTGVSNFTGTVTLDFTIVEPEPDKCTVTFDACGGSVVETTRQVEEGAAIGDLPVAVRKGYDFGGWYVMEGESLRTVAVDDVVTGDVTVLAIWNEIPEVPTYTVIVGAKVSIDVGLKGYKAKNLPGGLKYDAMKGLVSGTAKSALGNVEAVFTKSGADDVYVVFVIRKENSPTVACAGLSSSVFMIGVTAGIPLDISAESGVKGVTAKNLPTGLKLAQDKVTKEWVITGAPTKAGTFTSEITLTTVAGGKVMTTVTVTVATLPATTVGTASGFVLGASRDDPYVGTFLFTSTEAGKLSAKVVTAAGTYSFSATGWTAVTGGVYYAAMATKKGEKLTLALDTAKGWNETQLTGTFASGRGAAAQPVEAQRNAFGKLWHFDATGSEGGGWTLNYAENAKSCALTVMLNADGKTAVVGKLGTLKVSASGCADVRAIADGAIIADFATVVTSGKVKKMLTLRTNLWFDKKNAHEEGVGSAVLAK